MRDWRREGNGDTPLAGYFRVGGVHTYTHIPYMHTLYMCTHIHTYVRTQTIMGTCKLTYSDVHS